MKLEEEPRDMDGVEDLSAHEGRVADDAHDASQTRTISHAATYIDPFDDVFGSSPSQSSSYFPASESQAASSVIGASGTADLSLRDDVNDSRSRRPASAHPSDIHRLQTEHMTAGYREGISTAKQTTVQQGFDEGFSLGATIGTAAGRLLGTIEGISEALGQDQDANANGSLQLAREELSAGRIFSADYWAPDGNWKFPVEVDPATGRAQDEILFADVARSHPLISKWVGIARREAERYGVDESIVGEEAPQHATDGWKGGEAAEDRGRDQDRRDGEEEDGCSALDQRTGAPSAPTFSNPTSSSKKALDW